MRHAATLFASCGELSNSHAIKSLRTENGVTIGTDKDILQEAKNVYQKLYTSSKAFPDLYDSTFYPKNNVKKFDDLQKESCEGTLKLLECLEALKSIDNNKSPVLDGLPAEFYKVFWQNIHTYLINALNSGYKKGTLSVSQRRGLISLLPKKNKILYQLKNWRPISLLNCDYKISTKAIAVRVKTVLPSIINPDQTGFLKGRFIGENIRLIDGVIDSTEFKGIPGLLLFVDFEKAFNTLEWSFIVKTLHYYNFGPSFISWVKTFYSNASSTIQNNGWSSKFFPLSRGVRQGCPLSPYLVILCAEVLGSAIRKEQSIRGINVLGVECKISQYADDTTLILDGSKSSLQKALNLLDIFANISGLHVNYEKTEALWIGELHKSTEILFPQRKIKWARRKALGIWFSTCKGETVKLNYDERKEKLDKLIENWQFRRLTLLGKITVIKSLLASQLVYILTPLPTQQKALEEINRALYTFLWDGRGDKIKRTEMIDDYEKGGLKMLDIQIFNRALKSIWIQKYLDDNNTGKWKLIFDFYLSKQGGKHLFSGNLRTKDVQNLGLGNEFLNEILCIWAEINFQETLCDFQNSPLWHNSLIRVANQSFFFEKWSNKSINCIKNLLDDNSKFLTLQAFSCKYKIKVNFLDYYGLLSAIRKFESRSCLGEHNHQNNPLRKLLKSPKISKKVYKILIDRKASTPFKSQDKWKLACGEINKDIKWNKAYIFPFQCTNDTNLQSFQFKLLHRRTATNDFLNKIGVSLSAMCTFCNEYVETLEHVFWEYKFSQSFWKNVTEWLTKNLNNYQIYTSQCLLVSD